MNENLCKMTKKNFEKCLTNNFKWYIIVLKKAKGIDIMTNFEYIMNKMTDRDLADFIECGFFAMGNGSSLSEKAYNAYEKWANNLNGCGGNMYFIDDTEHQPNVFQTADLHFYKGTRAEHKKMRVAEIGNSKNCNKYAMHFFDVMLLQFICGYRGSTS